MAKKVISKVARGQVWMVNGDDVNFKSNPGSVTAKTRPYLVVSCKENNLHSTTFNAVAIFTAISAGGIEALFPRYPSNVLGEIPVLQASSFTFIS